MAEIWIALDAAERRKNWQTVAYVTVVCAGVAFAVALSEGPGSRWWVISIFCTWLIVVIHLVGRGYRRALLTSHGISFNGP